MVAAALRFVCRQLLDAEVLELCAQNPANAWQIGMNPTITYNDKAEGGSDNKWNVPIGGGVAKMILIGNTPVKIQVALEKSIVRQDEFGLDWNFRVNVIPVILSPQKNPFFGN